MFGFIIFSLIQIDQVNLTSQKGMCGPHVIDYFPKQINKPNLSKRGPTCHLLLK